MAVHIYTQTIHRTIQNKQYIEQHNNATPDTTLRNPFWEILLQEDTFIYCLLNNALDEITQHVEIASFSCTDKSGAWMAGEPVFDSGRSKEFFLFNNVHTGFDTCSLGTFFPKSIVAGMLS